MIGVSWKNIDLETKHKNMKCEINKNCCNHKNTTHFNTRFPKSSQLTIILMTLITYPTLIKELSKQDKNLLITLLHNTNKIITK